MKKTIATVIMLLCVWPAAVFAQADSCDITQLPFTETFDSLPVENIGNNACWNSSPLFVNQSPCVYAPSWSGGNKCLWLRSYSVPSIVVLPKIFGQSINTLKLSMNVRTNNYVELFEVGVMTNPDDFSTFVPVDTIKNCQLNLFEHHRVYFNHYADTGQYIALRWYAVDAAYYDYCAYVDDIVVDFGADCAEVEHLRVQDITGHSARISWEKGPVGDPVDHQIECFNTVDSTIQYFFTIPEEYLLDGLSPNTPYVAKVTTYCEGGTVSDIDSISFTTQCPSGGDLVFGHDDFSRARSFPNHKHSVTEEIYTASDLGGARWLNSMSLRCATANSNRNVAIYLMKVEEEMLTHLVNVTSDAVKVYDGLVPVTAGWITIPFFQDYYYDGTSNLLMVIHDKTNAYGANSPNAFFCMSEPEGNAVFVAKNDNIGINPMAAANFNGTIYHYRHQIIFGDVCDNTPDCVSPYATITDITSTSANLEFLHGAQENVWRVEYRKSNDSAWIVLDTVLVSPCPLTALEPNTRYLVRIRPLCSDTLEHWTTRTFTTECGLFTQIPISYSFEENLSSEDGSAFPACWQRHSSSESVTVSVVTDVTRAHGGEHFLHFPAISGGAIYAVMPEMDASITIDSLQVKFYLSHSGSGTLEVGVMYDPMDTASFVSLGQITPFAFGSYEKMVYPLYGCNGAHHVAFRVTGTAGDGIMIDDLTLDYSNGCFVPSNVTVGEIGPFSATIGWQEFGASQEWEIEYNTVNFSPGAGTRITATDNPFTLTELQANHNYYFYVRSKCDMNNYSDWTNIYTFTTPCYEIDHFPFTEDFSTPGSGNGYHDLVECWGRLVNENVTSTSGTLALWYYPGVAVMPRIADYDISGDSINIRYLKLDMKVNYYDTNDHVTIGVLMDPNDISTFQAVKEINDGYYKHQEVFFYGYNGTGRHIAIKNKSNSHVTMDNFVLTQVDYTCAPPVKLTCDSVGSSSTLVHWEAGPVGEPLDYTLQYKQRTSNNWIVVSESLIDNQYLLTGLDPATWYDIRVRTRCTDSVYGEWDTEALYTKCFAGGVTAIGNGTNVTSSFPVANAASYITRQLFTSAEMGTAGNIYSVSFKAREPLTRYRIWKIYLQHTNLIKFNHMQVLENLNPQQVFEGTVDIQDGWFTIHFDTPFYYNGTSNVVLTVQDITGVPASSANVYYYHQGTGFYCSWGAANLTPADQFDVNGNYSTQCNNIIFTKDCDTTVTCGAPNLFIDSVGGNEVSLSWAAGFQETAWELEYKRCSDTVWIPVPNPTGFHVTISGLQLQTDYQIRMRSVCGPAEYGQWTTRTFTTGCGDIVQVPYVVDFETFVPAGTQNYVECWQRLEESAYVIANQGTTEGVTSNHCLQMTYNANTQPYALAILPRLGDSLNINNLAVTLNMKSVNVFPLLEIGLMSDAADTSTFELVGTLSPVVDAWTQAFVPLVNYASDGRYIALRVSNGSLYVDDLQVREVAACETPINFVVDNIVTESADLLWTDVAGAAAWIVEYGTAGFTPGTGVQMAVSNPNVTLTGLLPATTYTVYVSADCGNEESVPVSVEFTTLCGTDFLPFYQNFDSCGSFPECWGMEYVSGTRDWSIVTPSSNPSGSHSGTKAISLKNSSTTAETTMLITPPLRLLDVNQPRLRFWHTQAKWYSDQDTLVILYRTSATAPWTAITHYSNDIPTWTLDSLFLPDPTNTYQIAFQGTVRYGYGIYLDDVTVTGEAIAEPDTCIAVSMLTVSEIGNDYITLDWAQNGEYDYWAVVYREVGALGWDTMLTTVRPFTINGLQGLTTYEMFVVNYCENGVPSNSDTIPATTTNIGIADYDRYVKIYPNPTNDIINVQCNDKLSGVKIQIVDMHGKLVRTVKLGRTPSLQRIDICDLAKGVYFLKLEADGKTVAVRKVMKQ